MKIKIEGIIVIEREINKISRAIAKQFKLHTGCKTPKVIKTVKELTLSEKHRGFLNFLGVTAVVGESSMEYNNYHFIINNKTTYTGYDYSDNDDDSRKFVYPSDRLN